MDITVKPNQSLADVVLNACGTLEAGMQLMAANNSSLSEEPTVGDAYSTSAAAISLSDNGCLRYLSQNEIIIGTKGEAPPPPPSLEMTVVLKPVMHAVPLSSIAPATLGYYTYEFEADTGFINTYPLLPAYLSVNEVSCCTLAQWLSGVIPSTAVPFSIPPMPLKQLGYHLTWPGSLGQMMQFSNTSAPTQTVTFKDVNGNKAYAAPLIIFDTTSQNVSEYLIADIDVELVSSSGTSARVRITRSHAPAVSSPMLTPPYGHVEMFWWEEAVGGAPDPADPTNPDKTILTLGPGSHTIGVISRYVNDVLHLDYPKTAVSLVIEIS